MNLEKISPIIEKIIKDVLLERRYPYGWTKFGVSNKNASGNLIDYISVRTESSKNQSTLELYMLYYADVVDKGRRKGEYVSPMAIMEWIKNKGINVRDDKGRFVKGNQKFRKNLTSSFKTGNALPMAFAISRSIKDNGIRATNFLDIALERIKNNTKIEALLGDAVMQDLINLTL